MPPPRPMKGLVAHTRPQSVYADNSIIRLQISTTRG